MGSPLGHSLTNAFLSCHEKTGYTVLRKDLNQFFNDIFFIELSFEVFSRIPILSSMETERQNKFFFSMLSYSRKR